MTITVSSILSLAGLYPHWMGSAGLVFDGGGSRSQTALGTQPQTLVTSPFGRFPRRDDPFLFIPCTNASVVPALEDPEPQRSWAELFDPDPEHWSWTPKPTLPNIASIVDP